MRYSHRIQPRADARGPDGRLEINSAALIYLAIVATTFVVSLRRPGAALGLLLCTFGLEQWAQSQSSFFWIHGALTNLVTAAVACGAIAMRARVGKPVVADLPREFWLVIFFYAWAALSVVWSVYPTGTYQQLMGESEYIFAFAILAPLVAGDREDVRDALYALLAIGAVLCLLLLTTSQWRDRVILFKTGSTLSIEQLQRGNPLSIGTLGASVALAAILMNFRGAARVWQALRYVVIALAFAVTIKSGSRGQTIGLVLGGLIFLPYSRRFRNLSSFVGFATSLVLFAGIGIVLFDQLTRNAYDERSTRWTLDTSVATYQNDRLAMASFILGAYVQAGPFHWLLGLGSSASFDPRLLGFYPHMVPAEALAELGVVGITYYLLLIYFTVRNLRELWPLVREDPETRGIVAVLGALAFLGFTLSLKESSLISSGTYYGIVVLLGRLAGNVRRDAARYAEIAAAGYAVTADDLAREAAAWGELPADDGGGGDDDEYAGRPAAHA